MKEKFKFTQAPELNNPEVLKETKFYAIDQYHYGHQYQWIYTKKQIESECPEIFNYCKADNTEINEDAMVYWPIGGSNSSSTYIHYLGQGEVGLEATKEVCLNSTCDGPDLEDPELIDIAEYTKTLDEEYGITGDLIRYWNVPKNLIEQTDSRYNELIERGLPASAFYDIETENLRIYENEAEINELIKEAKER